jgi:hypothetical protein
MVEVLEERYGRTAPEEIAGSYPATKWCVYTACAIRPQVAFSALLLDPS